MKADLGMTFPAQLEQFLKWLEATPLATTIRENEFLFPWIESVHVLAIVLVVGTISIIDLRLLGVASLDRAATYLMRAVLPLTWATFVIAAITGGLLFATNAPNYAHNFFFQGKMVLLATAGLNMAVFHAFGLRNVASWDTMPHTPPAAKAAGAVSLLLWVAVIAFGRWIGFTLH
jgi:hypothetical protein